jgi:hypothetical protein
LIVAKKMADSIAAFLAEVVALEEKYGLSISHEDHGGIVPYRVIQRGECRLVGGGVGSYRPRI